MKSSEGVIILIVISVMLLGVLRAYEESVAIVIMKLDKALQCKSSP